MKPWAFIHENLLRQQPVLLLYRVHAPIGLDIYSKAPAVIAVSVAAEIILEKNRGLPTGREGGQRLHKA